VPLDVNHVIRGMEKLLRRLIRADIALETLVDVPAIASDDRATMIALATFLDDINNDGVCPLD